MPFVNSNIEYVVLLDSEKDLEISEVYRSFEITSGQIVSQLGRDISDFLGRVDFPRHKFIVTPNIGIIGGRFARDKG